ncbi:hypothetical protein pdul_cds_912 [Pandoravirus dulcis]|uniref:Uncharacterized protein n=1 Tax=Pandoravirus dulcis TaxID=1349409 RepID=A0A291AUD7_9VIRU|nr:hypothetical protein pdul_cds_912 [Pandoravirus dulcis]ATE82565.1 hypothetical protein pdul_cds_912 [Pandoravirus dulcis]
MRGDTPPQKMACGHGLCRQEKNIANGQRKKCDSYGWSGRRLACVPKENRADKKAKRGTTHKERCRTKRREKKTPESKDDRARAPAHEQATSLAHRQRRRLCRRVGQGLCPHDLVRGRGLPGGGADQVLRARDPRAPREHPRGGLWRRRPQDRLGQGCPAGPRVQQQRGRPLQPRARRPRRRRARALAHQGLWRFPRVPR